VSEDLVQAGVDGDQTVQGGQGDEAVDLGPGDRQPDLATLGAGSPMRADQGVQAGGIAEPGPRTRR
jgi:hypothetical protein